MDKIIITADFDGGGWKVEVTEDYGITHRGQGYSLIAALDNLGDTGIRKQVIERVCIDVPKLLSGWE